MIEEINPQFNTSVATSCVESAMASSSDEGEVAAPFTLPTSAEEELVMDENASTLTLVPNPCVVPHLAVAVHE